MEYFSNLKAKLIYVFRIPDAAHSHCLKIGEATFDDGDITYCPQNNTVAIFYAQTSRPDLTMRVIPMGRVTSPLDPLSRMPRNVTATFSLNSALSGD